MNLFSDNIVNSFTSLYNRKTRRNKMEENYRETLKACYIGFITQAILNNLAPLLFVVFQDWYDVSFEMLSG